jgi:hypothetical protein
MSLLRFPSTLVCIARLSSERKKRQMSTRRPYPDTRAEPKKTKNSDRRASPGLSLIEKQINSRETTNVISAMRWKEEHLHQFPA